MPEPVQSRTIFQYMNEIKKIHKRCFSTDAMFNGESPRHEFIDYSIFINEEVLLENIYFSFLP